MTDLGGKGQSQGVDMSTEEPSVSPPQLVAAELGIAEKEAFFREIYDDHFRYVWRSLKRYGVWERDLDDACHDVFIVVHRKLGEFDMARAVKPWLLGISFRVASDFRRRSQHRREIVSDDQVPVDEKTRSQDEMVEVNRKRAVVYKALETLDLNKRAVFVMHDMQEHGMPEVAEALGVPLNTCYSRLRAARKLFSEAIRSLGLHTAGSARKDGII